MTSQLVLQNLIPNASPGRFSRPPPVNRLINSINKNSAVDGDGVSQLTEMVLHYEDEGIEDSSSINTFPSDSPDSLGEAQTLVTFQESENTDGVVAIATVFADAAEEDEDDEDECELLKPNPGSQDRTKSAIGHLRHFMPSFFKFKKEQLHMVDIDDLVCEGRNKEPRIRGGVTTNTGTDPEDINTYNPNARKAQWYSEMLEGFQHYLAHKAHKFKQSHRPLISHNAASNYLSDVKMWILRQNTHITSGDIPILDPARWKSSRQNMLCHIVVRCRNDGSRVSNGHLPATQQDRKAMALACVWLGTKEGAEFFHLNTSTYHFAGRGSECSLVLKKDTTTRPVSEGNKEYDNLHVFLKRHKTHKEQDMSIFAHKLHWHQCFYFSTIYQILLSQETGEYILPTYAQKANFTTKGRTVSKVASHWTTMQKVMMDVLPTDIAISEGLTSHSQKKGANQTMSGLSSVSGLAQIFRSGWQVRGVHSLLEYVVGDQVMQDQAGKALAGWTTQFGNQVIGGEPPNLDDISSEHEKLAEFVNQLFVHDSQSWTDGVKCILTATLIRHFDAFKDDLALNPKGRSFDHPLVHLVNEKLLCSNVSQETFTKWKKEINDGYRIRNIAALPFSMLDGQQQSRNGVDLRSFADSLNNLHQFVSEANGNMACFCAFN